MPGPVFTSTFSKPDNSSGPDQRIDEARKALSPQWRQLNELKRTLSKDHPDVNNHPDVKKMAEKIFEQERDIAIAQDERIPNITPEARALMREEREIIFKRKVLNWTGIKTPEDRAKYHELRRRSEALAEKKKELQGGNLGPKTEFTEPLKKLGQSIREKELRLNERPYAPGASEAHQILIRMKKEHQKLQKLDQHIIKNQGAPGAPPVVREVAPPKNLPFDDKKPPVKTKPGNSSQLIKPKHGSQVKALQDQLMATNDPTKMKQLLQKIQVAALHEARMKRGVAGPEGAYAASRTPSSDTHKQADEASRSVRTKTGRGKGGNNKAKPAPSQRQPGHAPGGGQPVPSSSRPSFAHLRQEDAASIQHAPHASQASPAFQAGVMLTVNGKQYVAQWPNRVSLKMDHTKFDMKQTGHKLGGHTASQALTAKLMFTM